MYMLERCRRKEERSKQGQTNNKAKQHSTPKAVTFPKLPQADMLERCRRKEERSKQGQTNNKAKQHSTPKAVTFPKKNELPRVRCISNDTQHLIVLKVTIYCFHLLIEMMIGTRLTHSLTHFMLEVM